MPSKFAVALKQAEQQEQDAAFREQVLAELAELKALLYAVIPTGDDDDAEAEKPSGKKPSNAKQS